MILDVPWGVQVLLIKNRRNPQILFLAYIICLWQFFMDTERAHTPQLLSSPPGCEQCQSYVLLLLSNLILASPLPGLALQLEWEHSELKTVIYAESSWVLTSASSFNSLYLKLLSHPYAHPQLLQTEWQNRCWYQKPKTPLTLPWAPIVLHTKSTHLLMLLLSEGHRRNRISVLRIPCLLYCSCTTSLPAAYLILGLSKVCWFVFIRISRSMPIPKPLRILQIVSSSFRHWSLLRPIWEKSGMSHWV